MLPIANFGGRTGAFSHATKIRFNRSPVATFFLHEHQRLLEYSITRFAAHSGYSSVPFLHTPMSFNVPFFFFLSVKGGLASTIAIQKNCKNMHPFNDIKNRSQTGIIEVIALQGRKVIGANATRR